MPARREFALPAAAIASSLIAFGCSSSPAPAQPASTQALRSLEWPASGSDAVPEGHYDYFDGLELDSAIPQPKDSIGHDVEWHDYPMPHSVCAEEVADLNQWLLGVLA